MLFLTFDPAYYFYYYERISGEGAINTIGVIALLLPILYSFKSVFSRVYTPGIPRTYTGTYPSITNPLYTIKGVLSTVHTLGIPG